MRAETVGVNLVSIALLLATGQATAQTSPRGDDGGPRSVAVAVAARYAAMPSGQALDRGARDPVRLTARDYASIAAPVVTPYRSTPSGDVAPDGFSMRVPGTGLDLTNGSISIRRNDARSARGVNISVQLTY